MLPSELAFGAFLAYTPRPRPDHAAEMRAKDVMVTLKRDARGGSPPLAFSRWVARALAAQLHVLAFRDCFGTGTALVPVPSSGLKQAGDLRVSLNLARAMEENGLGTVLDCLRRFAALPKAATAIARGIRRPTAADHCRTLRVEACLDSPAEILLVDDVITRGATVLGAAGCILAHYPKARVRAFAVMRTISDPEDFTALRDPCVGRVTLSPAGATFRRP